MSSWREHRRVGQCGDRRRGHVAVEARVEQHLAADAGSVAVAGGQRDRRGQRAAGTVADDRQPRDGRHPARSALSATHVGGRVGVVELGGRRVLRREPVVDGHHGGVRLARQASSPAARTNGWSPSPFRRRGSRPARARRIAVTGDRSATGSARPGREPRSPRYAPSTGMSSGCGADSIASRTAARPRSRIGGIGPNEATRAAASGSSAHWLLRGRTDGPVRSTGGRWETRISARSAIADPT